LQAVRAAAVTLLQALDTMTASAAAAAVPGTPARGRKKPAAPAVAGAAGIYTGDDWAVQPRASNGFRQHSRGSSCRCAAAVPLEAYRAFVRLAVSHASELASHASFAARFVSAALSGSSATLQLPALCAC
jgi:hypothetical protein